MKADIRIAWILARGSERREWWRASLTLIGALLATGFALAAVTVAAVSGQVSIPYAHGLLDRPGERAGVVFTLVLLLVPVLGFLGQCARIGAVHRYRRMAGLRLAGASPGQVRRIAAVESAFACLAGSSAGFAVFLVLLAATGHSPRPVAWAGFTAVVLAVPVAAALVSALALRHVVASPLEHARRTVPGPGRRAALGFLLAVALIAMSALLLLFPVGPRVTPPVLLVLALVLLTGAGAIWAAGASAAFIGRTLSRRAKRPAVLIAASRLAHDPWAAARTHAALLLVTVVAVGFVGVRAILLDTLTDYYRPVDLAFYTTGIDLAGAAVLIALAISACALAVGAAESLATRRRGLAAQAAAGVPHRVLAEAALLETALPLAPALLLAGLGGTVVYVGYAMVVVTAPVPLLPLLVPVTVYAACLLAAATSLPLLRRAVHPAELRFT
ncbi:MULTISPECIES: FtsX-like permease family protein [unclassified Streptomyces]|uniref:FtsX-like permease family protein n=1 Tax=unclassified Streptomyces TaxID=2593676 RepID=UPI0011C87FB0|nr:MULTISPECIES: FtsX-like permease family protein [unclassified Streptomyces]WSQ76325.1 ABC transporter permease [Streptomyces sp. NBC_01213]MDF6017641.1 ABC transporter permease [Streptomyces sp. JH34]TXS17689.1 ABC transporter permease [Streptomyces sp. wa22]WSQ83572.1 ABC transporter permease [Streptomyces sp. NBC_01212]WSR10398.1 ABC transporter permease [Streptomyces sp. NBC_01208]